MSGPRLLAGIDQGTTGTTVLLIDEQRRVRGRGYREIPQHYPAPGLVEHDPEALWSSVVGALADARAMAGAHEIAAIGITNQRETTILWERATGKAVARAIVWQDRRTASVCEAMKQAGLEPEIREATGLVIDPYFSGTKVAWLLDHVGGLRDRADRGEIAFGTVDSFLVWRLSGGQRHVTDVSNASRTLLFDFRSMDWSDALCDRFKVPRALLPAPCPSVGVLARTVNVPGLDDGIPVAGMAGDQQAALYGQGCTEAGDAKCTFGTGSFLLMNVGDEPVVSRHRLLGTVAWQRDGRTSYALEGSAFVSGALVQWLRDGLGIITKASEIEAVAASVPDSAGVTIVPALAGLGAPHWRPEARGVITGITRGTTRAHIARAALEAMALQNVELVRAMEADAGRPIRSLRVDGGATVNDLLMQIQADLLGVDIIRPSFVELTALGAALLAGAGVGFPGRAEPGSAQLTTEVTTFHPSTDWSDDRRAEALANWKSAVAKA